MTQSILTYLFRRNAWITLADIVAVTQCNPADLDALAAQGKIRRDDSHRHGPEYRLTDEQRASMAEGDKPTPEKAKVRASLGGHADPLSNPNSPEGNSR